jgi:prepilin-type N-terminal cleavage/methylation domain-containing protein
MAAAMSLVWRVRDRRAGFSLVELLVVMGILAMMALVTVPWFIKLAQRNQIKSAARELSITLAAARMRAVKANRPVSVVITQLTPPMELRIVEATPPAPTPTPKPGLLILPATAARFVETPNAPGGWVTFGGDGRLVNPPPVPTPALVYTLEGPVNATVRNQIKIEATLGGGIQIVTPTNWQ